MKPIILIIVCFFASCTSKVSKFKDSDFEGYISVSRYKGANWDNLNSIYLDSTGLFKLRNDKEREIIDNVLIYDLIKNIDTSKINNLVNCFDTVDKFNGNEYLYRITIKKNSFIKNYDIPEIYNTDCSRKLIDTLRIYFMKEF